MAATERGEEASRAPDALDEHRSRVTARTVEADAWLNAVEGNSGISITSVIRAGVLDLIPGLGGALNELASREDADRDLQITRAVRATLEAFAAHRAASASSRTSESAPGTAPERARGVELPPRWARGRSSFWRRAVLQISGQPISHET